MKRVLAISLSLMMIISLAACNSESTASKPIDSSASESTASSETSASEVPTDENVEITAWVGPAWRGVYDPTEPNAENGDFHRKVAEDYMAQHSNVKINVEVIASAEREEKLSVALQSNTQPDVMFEASFLTFDYAHAGLLEPLNDILTEEDKADIADSIWNEVTGADDNVYLFPFTAETGHIGINKNIFVDAGAEEFLPKEKIHGIGVWTPEEFEAALAAVSGVDGVYPFAMYAGKTAGDTWTNVMLRMYGASFFDENTTEVKLNSEEGIKALTFLKGLQDKGYLAPGIETLTVEDAIQMFLNKKLAVCVFNNLSYGNLKNGLSEGTIEEPFDLEWVYIINEDTPACFSYIKGSLAFKTGDPSRTAVAKDFIKFYSSGEPYVDASMAMTPVRKSVTNKLREKDEVLANIADSLEYSVPFSQKAPGYLTIRTLFIPEMQAVFTNQKTPEEALNDFATNTNESLKQNAERSVIINPN